MYLSENWQKNRFNGRLGLGLCISARRQLRVRVTTSYRRGTWSWQNWDKRIFLSLGLKGVLSYTNFQTQTMHGRNDAWRPQRLIGAFGGALLGSIAFSAVGKIEVSFTSQHS
jgi:hypothetical protein